MSQPIGLAGRCRATTTPTAVVVTISTTVCRSLSAKIWFAEATGIVAASRASTTAPRTSAVSGDARRRRLVSSFAVITALAEQPRTAAIRDRYAVRGG